MPQMQLPFFPHGATEINVNLAIIREGDKVTYPRFHEDKYVWSLAHFYSRCERYPDLPYDHKPVMSKWQRKLVLVKMGNSLRYARLLVLNLFS